MNVNLDILRAAILYVGFLFILLWRSLNPWRPGINFGKKVNYSFLLYVLLVLLYVFDVVVFVFAAMKDFRASAVTSNTKSTQGTGWPVMWVRVLVIAAPVVVFVTLVMCWRQSKQHIDEIKEDVAVMQHDRALNIVALPAVYGVMALSALVIVYAMVTDEKANPKTDSQDHWEKTQAMAFAQYETCFYVAELYQAWALYQFCMLTIEQIEFASSKSTSDSPSSDTDVVRQLTGPNSAMTFQAMSSVILVGTYLFCIVNLVQSAVSLYMWMFTDTLSNWSEYESSMAQFRWAGMIASATAIYNVHIIESTFDHYLADYFPFTKFLSVKLLVFFSFWQKPFITLLKWVGVINLTDLQVQLMQAAVLVLECLLGAVMHWWAWDPREAWYTEKMSTGETEPLTRGSGNSNNPFYT